MFSTTTMTQKSRSDFEKTLKEATEPNNRMVSCKSNGLGIKNKILIFIRIIQIVINEYQLKVK